MSQHESKVTRTATGLFQVTRSETATLDSQTAKQYLRDLRVQLEDIETAIKRQSAFRDLVVAEIQQIEKLLQEFPEEPESGSAIPVDQPPKGPRS